MSNFVLVIVFIVGATLLVKAINRASDKLDENSWRDARFRLRPKGGQRAFSYCYQPKIIPVKHRVRFIWKSKMR